MGRPVSRGASAVLVFLALSALWAAGAAPQPGKGPRETVDQRFTTTRPGAPTGMRFEATYHAAGDRKGNPPYLRRQVQYPPRGMRFDTSVPKRCTASDAELQLSGPSACPAGSLLGRGSTAGIFMVPFSEDAVFHRFRHRMYVLNNTNEQIVLVESEGFTVVRGKIRPDGAIVFTPPSCFPTPPAGGCADDYIVQLETTTHLRPYTKTVNGRVRSYATTPPKCPARGYWRSVVRFRWSDGTADSVATRQPCRPTGR
jgi:hypothetical protein